MSESTVEVVGFLASGILLEYNAMQFELGSTQTDNSTAWKNTALPFILIKPSPDTEGSSVPSPSGTSTSTLPLPWHNATESSKQLNICKKVRSYMFYFYFLPAERSELHCNNFKSSKILPHSIINYCAEFWDCQTHGLINQTWCSGSYSIVSNVLETTQLKLMPWKTQAMKTQISWPKKLVLITSTKNDYFT